MKQGVDIKLVGGIGNQLFGYFAAFDLANLNNCNLYLDVSDMRQKRNRQHVSIESLILPGEFYAKKEYPKLLQRIFGKIQRLLSNNVLKQKIYFSKVIGFDENIYKLEPNIKIHGYFQSYVHFKKYKDIFGGLKLRAESEWFKKHSLDAQNNSFTCLHIRRGDYVEHQEIYGLLSSEYYINALEMASQWTQNRNLWVFSDDIEAAKKVLINIKGWKIEWVDPSQTNDPVEQLLIMSKADCFILANSTFSWWSAALGKESSYVIAPTKWYRGIDDPLYLIPENWHRCESLWEKPNTV